MNSMKHMLLWLIICICFGPCMKADEQTFKVTVVEKLPKKIYAFWPIPKKGCPSGYYEVGRAFFDGLQYHPACWSKELKVIEKVESTIRYEETERRYDEESKNIEK